MGCGMSQVDKDYKLLTSAEPLAPRCQWIARRDNNGGGGRRRKQRSSTGSSTTSSSSSSSSSARSSLRSKSTRRISPAVGGPGSSSRRITSMRGLRSSSSRQIGGRQPRSASAKYTASSKQAAWDGGNGGSGGGSGGGAVSDSSSPKDFEFLSMLGRGTLGRVFLAKHKRNGKYYAIKRVAKAEVCRRHNIKGVLGEIDTLRAANSPFLVHMFAAIQDDRYIYMVLGYAVGGEIYARMGGPFNEDSAKFYMAEIFLALKYMHRDMLTAFRDLKPENILIDQTGHVQLVDFGFSVKLDTQDHEIPKSCGTTQYMAPELIQKKAKHGLPVDWWAAGCVMFEMLTGRAPFGDIGDKSKWEIYHRVQNAKFKFPSFVSKPARELIAALLQLDPSKRAKWETIERSAWLAGIDWNAVAQRRLVPPFLPDVEEVGHRDYYPKRPAKDDKDNVPLSRDQLQYCDITQPRTR